MKSKSKYILLISLFSLMVNFSFGQSLDEKIEKRMLELKNISIDTIVKCDMGCLPIYNETDYLFSKECIPREISYLFWIKNGIYYKQRFDDCKSYPSKALKKSKFLSIVISQIDVIKKAEIKSVQYTIKDLKENSKSKTFYLDIDHDCFTIFNFFISEKFFTKKLSHFMLETKILNEKDKNDNYDFNQKSILNTLKKLIEKEL